MATITTRAGKGSPLTNTEVDNNFTNINTELGQKESASNKGVANGYASLDGSGKVPSTQLPSYVDDVVEGANLAALPATGETGKIYVTLDTNKTYRWSGSAYVEISASPGSTDAVTEGSTNLYFTNARARSAISATGSLSYNSSTGVMSFTDAVTSVSGKTGAVTLTNSDVGLGNVENKSSATIRGELTSGNVTTALGFTPYNSSNPSGYITSSSNITGNAATATTASQLNGYFSSSYSGPTSAVKQFFWDNLSASGTQARTFEIARLGIDYNDWNGGSGPFEVELYEAYYSRGLKKKYVIHWGYTNTYGIQLVEYSGNGDNNFQVRIGTPVLVSGDNYYLPVFVDVKYYAGVDVVVTTNRDITSSNPPAIGTTFINASPSATNISDFTADSAVNFASTTAVQINGSQLLHAGNYSSYALPLSGGTMTGTLSFQQPVGLSFANGQYIKDNGGGGLVIYSGAAVNINHASGLTSNGNTILHAGNYSSYALPLSGGTLTGGLTGTLGYFSASTQGTPILRLKQEDTGGGYYLLQGLSGSTEVIRIERSGAIVSPTGRFQKNQTAGDYTTAALWTESYGSTATGIAFHISGNVGKFLEMRTNGILYWNSDTVIHSGNYNSWAPSLTGSGASGTWSINITGSAGSASNSTTVGGLTPAKFFNNMGNNHTTYTDFNNVPDFGAYYVQQGGNSPTGVASHQWYGFTLGLGNDYAQSSYASQLYWPRRAQNGETYIYVRDREGGTWNGWTKIRAGVADSAASLNFGGGYTVQMGDWGLRNTTPYGWIQLGPANTSHAHIYTNLSNIYFNVDLYTNGYLQLHSNNYNSYSPTLTGGGASGTWGINITGNAATATSATDSTKLPLSGGTVTGSTTFNSAVVIGGRDTRYFENDSFIEFYVAGDANTYYPVRFSPSVWFHFARWSISRGYADTAPWDPIGTGVHRGGLTLTWEWSGDGAWGGNDKTIRVSQFSEQYTTMVGGLALSVNGIIVWLRGGNAYYRFHGPGGVMNGVTQYYSTFTASDGSTYSPRSYNSGTVASEVTNRMPVRGVAELYDGGNRVLHAGNYSSYALPLSGGTVTGDLAVNGVVRTGWHGGTAYAGGSGASLYFGGDTGGAYRLWTSFENVGGNYTKLNIDWHTGIRIGAYWAYGGIRFYNDALGYGGANGYGNKVFSVAEGDSHVRVYNNLYVGGNLALHAGNYTSYSPSLTGGGASGTWGINITGNAGSASSVAWGNVSSRPGWMTSASLIDSQSNANSQVNSGFYENGGGGSNWPSQTWYNSINVRHSNQGNYHGFQIAMSYYDNNLWFRSYQGSGTFQSWAVALSSQNYNSYSPTLTGGGASGTWGINVTGESRSVNLGGTGHTITSSSWAGGGGYHGYTYSGGNFRFGFSSTGGVVDVYADGNFYATDSSYLVLHTGNYSSYALPLSGGAMTGNISGPAYNSPSFIRFASDSNWAYGCSYDGGSQYWMQVQFYGTGDDTRGFRVLNTNGNSVAFRVNGAGNAICAGNVTAYSDERVKANWRQLDDGFVAKLASVKSGIYDRTDIDLTQAGVSAQSLRNVLPQTVMESSDGELSVAYGNAALVSAVELAKEIVNLKREIEMLKTKLH